MISGPAKPKWMHLNHVKLDVITLSTGSDETDLENECRENAGSVEGGCGDYTYHSTRCCVKDVKCKELSSKRPCETWHRRLKKGSFWL